MALETPPLQFARGLVAGIPTGSDGEPLWTTDTLRLYIAQSSVNYPVVMQNDLGAGVFTFLTTPSSANLKSAVTDETGSGALVFATSPTFVTPILGTPTSGNLANCTAYALASLAGAGTGVLTWLATPTSANLAAAVTDETGSGALVFATSPTLVTPALGTPSALIGTNITGIPESGVTNLTTDLAAKAPLASPAFTGTPLSTTPAINDNSTKIATTAYADRQAASGTKTLTNTTFDTAGSGNSFSINGVAATANTGTGSVMRAASPTTTGTLTAATGTFSGNMFCGATSVSGSSSGDGCFARGTNSGYCYMGSNGSQYFGFNGSLFQFVGGGASFAGSLTVTGGSSQIQVCRRSDSAAAWTIYSASGELNFLSNLGGATTTADTSGNWTFGATITPKHIVGGSSTPGIAAGVGAGTSPTVSVTGTDIAGKVTVTTGTLPTGTNAVIATITFASSFAFAAAPYVVLFPANALTATISGVSMVFITSTTTTFVINSGTTALTAASTYLWNYIVVG